MIGVFFVLHGLLILSSQFSTAGGRRQRRSVSTVGAALTAPHPQSSVERAVKKGDKVHYKGATAKVVGIDFGLVPPSYVLQKEDGSEVETERARFSLIPAGKSANASMHSAAGPISKGLAECMAEAEGLPALHGFDLCNTLGFDEAKKRIACMKGVLESLSATPGLEWDEEHLHNEAAEICQSHDFDILQSKPVADCMSAALCRTTESGTDDKELCEDLARSCNSAAPRSVAGQILNGDTSLDPEVQVVRQNAGDGRRPKFVVHSTNNPPGISWELEKIAGGANKPITLSSPDEAVKQPVGEQMRDSGAALAVPGTGWLFWPVIFTVMWP